MKNKWVYKDKEYSILDFNMMKCPSSRGWVEAVRYIQLETSLIFTREKQDFYDKFKEIHI